LNVPTAFSETATHDRGLEPHEPLVLPERVERALAIGGRGVQRRRVEAQRVADRFDAEQPGKGLVARQQAAVGR
jgi:hypothetical protein